MRSPHGRFADALVGPRERQGRAEADAPRSEHSPRLPGEEPSAISFQLVCGLLAGIATLALFASPLR